MNKTTSVPETFSSRLRELRTNAREGQKEAAASIGINASTYSNYEADRNRKGSREPNLETLTRIASHYNVSTDYLLGLSDNNNTGINALNEELAKINNFISSTDEYEDETAADKAFDIKQYIIDILTIISKIALKQLESDSYVLLAYKNMIKNLSVFEDAIYSSYFDSKLLKKTEAEKSKVQKVIRLRAENKLQKALIRFTETISSSYMELDIMENYKDEHYDEYMEDFYEKCFKEAAEDEDTEETEDDL